MRPGIAVPGLILRDALRMRRSNCFRCSPVPLDETGASA
jgi:hypothetical protein